MKKLLVFFSTIFTLVVNGQTYYPFPDSNAVWNIARTSYCWLGVPTQVGEYYSITFSGDTLISGKAYHKMTVPFFERPTTSCGGGSIVKDIYKGAIRQDTAIKKVFIVPPSTLTEELLYDFTMQVGDTVKGYIETMTSPLDTIQSIDSVLIGSTYRKRWTINLGYDIYIIEGIGSTYGLIEPLRGNQVDGFSYSITCFLQDDQPLYPETTTNCELITTVNQTEKFSTQIKIFPNPASSKLFIELGSGTPSYKGEIRVMDVMGRTVISSQVDGNQFAIDISALDNGVYFIVLKNTNEVFRFLKE